jgi:hypothetical protein
MWDITHCTFISTLLESNADNTLQPSNFYYVLPLDRGIYLQRRMASFTIFTKKISTVRTMIEHVAVNLSISGWNNFCCTISYRLAVIFVCKSVMELPSNYY